jgi:hypothetical protein
MGRRVAKEEVINIKVWTTKEGSFVGRVTTIHDELVFFLSLRCFVRCVDRPPSFMGKRIKNSKCEQNTRCATLACSGGDVIGLQSKKKEKRRVDDFSRHHTNDNHLSYMDIHTSVVHVGVCVLWV